MKKTLISFIVWLVIILLLSEITRLVYNFIYYPAVNPENGSFDVKAAPNEIVLVIYAFSFWLAGVLMSWNLKCSALAIPISMSISVFWLAFESLFNVPLFFLVPSHFISIYTYVIHFIGMIVPPVFCVLGSMFFCKYLKNYQRG